MSASVKSGQDSCPSSSSVINARRTESLDAPYIVKLFDESTNEVFGRVDVVNVIEKAVLAITLSNEKEEVLGHAAFNDYPNVDNVDQAVWESWLKNNFEEEKCSALNTLFLHLFVSKPGFSHGCAKEIIRTAFTAVPEVHFLLLVVPDNVFPGPELADIFKPMTRLNGSTGSTTFICYRHDHIPVLHVRQARVEDNDDLAPIFNRQSEMLKSTYGDFFLAELIEAQDEDMQCLVTEAEGRACGFMSLSKSLNYDVLNECFELAPFNGLRKPHDEDVTEPPKPEVKEEASMTSISKTDVEEKESLAQEQTSTSINQSAEETTTEVEDGGTTAETTESADVVEKDTLEQELNLSGATMFTMSGEDSPRQLFTAEERFIPTYKGASNAFTIQLFCIDERYEMRSVDAMSKAFALFPDLDFCVITVPHLVPEFPLLQGFVRVTPRNPSILSQELYIFHRSGLLKNFRVRSICGKDVSAVENLVHSLDCTTDLLKDIKQFQSARRDDDGREMQVFVAECLDQIVGICVIKAEEEIEYIRSHYHIEDFIYFNHHQREEHGHIHHFALNPIFSHLSKHFMKEILRLGHKSCLYYPVYPIYADKDISTKHTMICALKNLVPVRPRRQIQYPLDVLEENAPSQRVLGKKDPFALFHINRKLTLEPKVTVNARIVVVGASDVGIAFLETLAYCPHLQFNNVTLISPHGLPGEVDEKLLKQFLSKSDPSNQDEKVQSYLHAWINIVYGKMTGIDRTRKNVVVDSKFIVPYDHLVLCVGQQYQIPCPTEAELDEGVTNKDLPNSPDRRFLGEQPNNLFVLNDDYDCYKLVKKITNSHGKNEGKIMIYGSSLDAFVCIQSLLDLGVPGNEIVQVEPPLAYDITCFNNEAVEKAISEVLKENSVEIHKGYILAGWKLNDDGCVTEMSFTSDDKPLTLSCGTVIPFYKKMVDLDAFKAINNACLVFDGKLVIDATFHTNDVCIRGAGTLTKYYRKYHADKWTHANFNSKEIGVALASEILKMFDPTLTPQTCQPEEELNLIPIYRLPKIQLAVLPGGYHYLHVKKPNLDVPLATQMQHEDYGQELLTGAAGSEGGDYFRLHLNLYKKVETITCLSKNEIPSNNLICLYGLHEKYLNNLLSRFKEGLITDFYAFFKESWCMAVYHDRFPDLRDELRELIITKPEEEEETFEDSIRQLIDDEMSLSAGQIEELMEMFKSKGIKQTAETRLLNYLSYNYYHLPMYAKPGMV